MDREVIAKIEALIQKRRVAHSYYFDRSQVYRSFSQLEHDAFREGALEKKEKELIATGISVVINCESCMEWHIHQSMKAGATEEEVIEAIGVGIEMSGGPGTVAARFAMDVLEYYRENDPLL